MRSRTSIALLSLVVACTAFAFSVGISHADIVDQTTYSDLVVSSSDSNVSFYIGTSTSALVLDTLTLALGNGNAANFSSNPVFLRVTCFANTTDVSQTGCTVTAPVVSTNSYSSIGTSVVLYPFYFSGLTLQSGKVYMVEIISASQLQVFGLTGGWNNVPYCIFAGNGEPNCSGTPFYLRNGTIPWGNISFPVVYSSSSQSIAASSSLWQNINFASSTVQCETGNLFSSGLCAAGVFLFVPNTGVLDAFAQMASTTIPSKFPFSWVYGFQGVYNQLTASSSANMIAVSIDFSSIDPATSTPFGGILPNATLLSSTTISTYLGSSMLSTLLFLSQCALWIMFGTFIFHDVQHRWLKQ